MDRPLNPPRLDQEEIRREARSTEPGGEFRERDAALEERDLALEQRDHALRERDRAFEQRNAAVWERDRAFSELDRVIAARDGSNSWRLTAPLRACRRGLARIRATLTGQPPASVAAQESGRFDTRTRISQPAQRTPEEIARIGTALAKTTSGTPSASIIIPVLDHIDYTLQCLDSIVAAPVATPFEIIVVDDGSGDRTPRILKDLPGIRLLGNGENRGFIRSCNAAAEIARGDFLVFLNNDTEVTAGWLDELLTTFDNLPDAGLVGSKLEYPDGRLQEAGAIIWNNGAVWNHGRNADPADPEFNYLREVDYCSGAALAVRREVFEECGGFDERYLPAYCEDSDLAFKVRQTGRRVYYQPLSVIRHYEGVTSGTDPTRGVKANQTRNLAILSERWKDEIASLQPEGRNLGTAKDRGLSGRILVLDHRTPTPDQDAGSLATLNLMRLLQAHGYQVTFIPESELDHVSEPSGYTKALQRIGIETLYPPYCSSVEGHLEACGKRYDGVLMIRPTVAERHLEHVREYCPQARRLYLAADLHFLRMLRQAEVGRGSASVQAARSMKEKELSVMADAHAVIVHSTHEARLLADEHGLGHVHVFGWAMEVAGTESPCESRRDICFVGSYGYSPNVDAVEYFVDQIFPSVRSRIPHVRFYVVGSNPPTRFKDLGGDVIVTGYVEDLNALLDGIRVAVAPLRFGAGTKGKISATLAAGLPCVATTLAGEGMGLTGGRNILLADTPEQFSDAIVELYGSRNSWNALSRASVEFARQAYGFERGALTIGKVLRAAGLRAAEDDELRGVRGTKGMNGFGKS